MVCQGLAKSREHMTYEEASVCLGATKTGSAHFCKYQSIERCNTIQVSSLQSPFTQPKMEMVTGNSIIRYITIME